ncbi:hypothetical protein Csa_005336 [Cucumis sativus]|nr:hypothetical protein Csa_005336 [Cucumis sativus]
MSFSINFPVSPPVQSIVFSSRTPNYQIRNSALTITHSAIQKPFATSGIKTPNSVKVDKTDSHLQIQPLVDLLRDCVDARMMGEGVTPDAQTFIGVAKAIGMLRDVNKAKEVSGYALELGVDSNTLVGTALIDMNSKCGSLQEARSIFNSHFITLCFFFPTNKLTNFLGCNKIDLLCIEMKPPLHELLLFSGRQGKESYNARNEGLDGEVMKQRGRRKAPGLEEEEK